MSLSETTRSVLRLVEERSGIPVHVEPDPNLPGTILAKVVMARENLLLHRVFYRPNSTTPPDYLICQQAGFILRFFAVPADRRFDFAASDAGTKAVEELVKVHPVAKMLPPQALPQLTTMLRDGLLSHLRSIPLGMRVDRWLADEFPDLIPLQKQSILRQLEDSAVTLAPQHRQTAPKLIFDATESISAAFAAYWARRLNQPQAVLPFKSAGYLHSGEILLDIWENTPDDAANDRLIVDQWAEKLGIAGWQQWVPYSTPR